VLLLALAMPLVAVPTAAILVATGDGNGAGPALAQGAIGGTFHPVAGTFVADGTRLADCKGRWTCLEQAFGNLAYRTGPKRALAVFESRLASDTDVEKDCHRIVHTIGSASLERNGGDVAKTFAQGSATCASGYYHGILERAFVGATTRAALAKKAATLCVAAGIRRRGFLDYQCRHGLGHGLMIQTGYDLPTALALCSRLGTGWDEITCTSGVFMENVSTRFGFRSRWLSDEDPLYPCNAVPMRHRRSCYVRATTWVLQTNGNDFEAASRTCVSAGARWASYCFRGLGRDAVVGATYTTLGQVLKSCSAAGRYQGDCLFGAARTFGDGAGLAGAKRAALLCERAPRADRDACVGGIGIVLGLLHAPRAARRAACASLTPEHVDACTAAANAEVDPSGRTSWG
jgi:hypothetical protein